MRNIGTSTTSVDLSVEVERDVCGKVVDVVLLGGALGFEPSWTLGLPRSLLPLPTGTLIGALAGRLSTFGNGTMAVCANGPAPRIAEHLYAAGIPPANVHVFEDWVPRGTAGCIKSCASILKGRTIFVAGASTWLEDDPEWMVQQHRQQGNILTIFCKPDAVGVRNGQNGWRRPAGLYCCEPEALEFIPDRGYYELKEQLLPALQKAGKPVGAVLLKRPTFQVADWLGYLTAVERALTNGLPEDGGFRQLAPGVWAGEDVEIASTARVVGPALLGHCCRLDDDVLVLGPAVLGTGTVVGAGSRLFRVVAPRAVEFRPATQVSDELVYPGALESGPVADAVHARESTKNALRQVAPACSAPTSSSPISGRRSPSGMLTATGLLIGLFAWAFWPTLVDLWGVWQTNPDYSAGQLVPLLAAYMIVIRRSALSEVILSFSLAGSGVFVLGFLINLIGCYYLYSSLENVGLVLCANGAAIALLGWNGYKRIWYPMLFLFLMIPLPGRVHDPVMLSLQELSAGATASVLEMVGIPVVRFGHVLEVASHQVAVAEACNGLRMVIAFLIVACSVAYFVRRPAWQKVVVLISSIPIALICNVARVAVTASLYQAGYERLAQGTTHDVAGLLMMPAAVGIILLELWLLAHLTVTPGEGRTLLPVPGASGEWKEGSAAVYR